MLIVVPESGKGIKTFYFDKFLTFNFQKIYPLQSLRKYSWNVKPLSHWNCRISDSGLFNVLYKNGDIMPSLWKIGRTTVAQVKDFLIVQHRFMASNWMHLIEISSNGKNASSAQWVVHQLPFGRILQARFPKILTAGKIGSNRYPNAQLLRTLLSRYTS